MKILLTGGAGFIGSNLTKALLEDETVSELRVLDNLSTGNFDNISEFKNDPKFHFIKGDITDFEVCLNASKNIDKICHQAALGSVPRSVKDPISTNEVNINGTLNIFKAAVDNNVERVVFASSSSVYGDNPTMPKEESKIGNALSPYALTKQVDELYAQVFSKNYNFKFIALRYFNIFGPKQSPKGPYAAVIPIFMEKALNNESPTINGDGNYSRDFTYIDNAVQANIKSLFTTNQAALNEAYNIALGERTTLNQLWDNIKKAAGASCDINHGPIREGDIPHSLANISKARTLLGYDPIVDIEKGLQISTEWYKNMLSEVV